MKPIDEKRISAIYNYKNCSNSHQRDELLNLLLAIINPKQIKIVIQDLNIKIK
jgi:hypothetical protein